MAAETASTAIEARKAAKNRRAQGGGRRAFFSNHLSSNPLEDPVATSFLKMATQEALQWGRSPDIEIKHLFPRLSMALQRGNAALLIARVTGLSQVRNSP